MILILIFLLTLALIVFGIRLMLKGMRWFYYAMVFGGKAIQEKKENYKEKKEFGKGVDKMMEEILSNDENNNNNR